MKETNRPLTRHNELMARAQFRRLNEAELNELRGLKQKLGRK